MQQQPGQPQQNYNDLAMIIRQLDRLEERTRDIVTRSDLEGWRKELVARDSLEPLINALTAQMKRVDDDRIADRKALEKRMDELENEQISRQERLWIRLSQVAGLAAFGLALFQLLIHLKIAP